MAVGIPGFDKIGLHYAAALGALLKNPEKKLSVFEDLTEDITKKAKELVDNGNSAVKIDYNERKLYVCAKVETDKGTGLSIIRYNHCNIIFTEVNKKPVFQKNATDFSASHDYTEKLLSMKFSEIKSLVESCTEEELAFMQDGIDINNKIADFGITHKTGVGIAQTLKKNIGTSILGDDLLTKIMIKTVSAIEGRLYGCPYSVMSSAGSGSKGVAVIIPISETAKYLNTSKEMTYKALAFGHLINSYINASVGKLSAMCTCSIASATAASASITWLMGGNDTQIGYAVRNMTGAITGMICDGGKVGCSLKLSSSITGALISALSACNNAVLNVSDGICGDSAEDCIANISRLSNLGMPNTDEEILKIMLDKQNKINKSK